MREQRVANGARRMQEKKERNREIEKERKIWKDIGYERERESKRDRKKRRKRRHHRHNPTAFKPSTTHDLPLYPKLCWCVA